MVQSRVAHFADPTQWPASSVAIVTTLGITVLVLSVEHTIVKHGRLRVRGLRAPLLVVAAMLLATALSPLPSLAQPTAPADALPDLISDPPVIRFTKEIENADGEQRLVLAFDGYLHNIGKGALEVSGNPQVDGGMKQLVFDGEDWQAVSEPTVQFETDDGHNHFHLMEAAHYALWNDARTELVGGAQKVGFCLIDTEQLEERAEASYLIDAWNYCGVDSPDETELTMGISPGWRDTYDANVTFQWVDISTVAPGNYWVSSIVDPNDEIVEADETNNDVVFSRSTFPVPGYVARPLALQDGSQPIELKADVYGTVGSPTFVIDEGPRNGKLDVPVGVDFASGVVHYAANPGFDGTDTFSYSVRDITSPFPHAPRIVQVEVDASDAPAASPMAIESQAAIEIEDNRELAAHVPVELVVSLIVDPDEDEAADATLGQDELRWFASNLPPGLTIDAVSGIIAGVPTYAGDYQSRIVAWSNELRQATFVEFAVAANDPPTLQPRNDLSTSSATTPAVHLGFGAVDASYEATGMPDGAVMVAEVPILAGKPTEIGTFDIQVNEIIDGEVTNTISFVWTLRASTRPAFVL